MLVLCAKLMFKLTDSNTVYYCFELYVQQSWIQICEYSKLLIHGFIYIRHCDNTVSLAIKTVAKTRLGFLVD